MQSTQQFYANSWILHHQRPIQGMLSYFAASFFFFFITKLELSYFENKFACFMEYGTNLIVVCWIMVVLYRLGLDSTPNLLQDLRKSLLTSTCSTKCQRCFVCLIWAEFDIRLVVIDLGVHLVRKVIKIGYINTAIQFGTQRYDMTRHKSPVVDFIFCKYTDHNK